MKFKIPVIFSVGSYVEVEACDLDEACEKIHDKPLPDREDWEYIDYSFEIDYDLLDCEYWDK